MVSREKSSSPKEAGGCRHALDYSLVNKGKGANPNAGLRYFRVLFAPKEALSAASVRLSSDSLMGKGERLGHVMKTAFRFSYYYLRTTLRIT